MRGLEWSHLAIHMCSSGSSPRVGTKTITQSKPLITGRGPDQVIVHLYDDRFMLMLTLFSLYSYSAKYNHVFFFFLTKDQDALMKPFSNTTGVRRSYAAASWKTNSNQRFNRCYWDKQVKEVGSPVCTRVCTTRLPEWISSCPSQWRCPLLTEDGVAACWVSRGGTESESVAFSAVQVQTHSHTEKSCCL